MSSSSIAPRASSLMGCVSRLGMKSPRRYSPTRAASSDLSPCTARAFLEWPAPEDSREQPHGPFNPDLDRLGDVRAGHCGPWLLHPRGRPHQKRKASARGNPRPAEVSRCRQYRLGRLRVYGPRLGRIRNDRGLETLHPSDHGIRHRLRQAGAEDIAGDDMVIRVIHLGRSDPHHIDRRPPLTQRATQTAQHQNYLMSIPEIRASHPVNQQN